MRARRVLTLGLAAALVAVGCSSDPDPSEPQTLVVKVDAAHRTGLSGFDNPTFRGSFLAYFPGTVAARPGDTVRFERTETGEPHSITLGSRVDAAFDKGGRSLERLPRIELESVQEIPQNLGQSCYLDEGTPPKQAGTPCEQLEDVPAFNGRQAWYSSGFIPRDEPFDLVLDGSIEEGSYRFYCVFHGSQMAGTLEVVAPGSTIATQSELDRRASEQVDAMVRPAKEQLEAELERYEDDEVFPLLAGMISDDGVVRINEFVPFTSRATTDQPISWLVTGVHNISFRAPGRAEPPGVERLLSGTVQFNEDLNTARASPKPPAEPPDESLVISADPYDGDQTHSTAVLRSPDGQITYEMTFSEPGTYRYQCLIHPGMGGIVTVTL